MSASSIPKLSVEEYLAADRAAEHRSEYYDGEVFPVVAATWQHGRISMNMAQHLNSRLHGHPCQAVNSTLRLRVTPTKFLYPDFVIVCGHPSFTDEQEDTLINPRVIIEVLSPSTADYDYGGKFALYRRLPSFEEYLLIAQDEPRVEVFRKGSDGRWILTSYEGLDATVQIESLTIEIPLSEIYFETTP